MICEHRMDSKKTHCVLCLKTQFEIDNWDNFSDRQRANHQHLIDKRRVHLVVGSDELLVYPGQHYTHVVKQATHADPNKLGRGFFPHHSFDEAARTVDIITNLRHKHMPLHIMDLMELPKGCKPVFQDGLGVTGLPVAGLPNRTPLSRLLERLLAYVPGYQVHDSVVIEVPSDGL